MRQLIKGEYVIFSLKPGYLVDRVMAYRNLRLPFVVASGQWEGKKERSIVVKLPNSWQQKEAHDHAVEVIANIIYFLGEKFFLYISAGNGLDAGRDAILMSTDSDNPTVEDQGKLIAVPREQAENVNHTVLNGIYYTTEKTMEGYNNG